VCVENLVVISDNNTAKRTVFGVDDFVVNGPKAVELQNTFIPLDNGEHLFVRLIANNMINER
jgi:hypothetical protein